MIKLNLGCGKKDIKEGWINIDIKEIPGVKKMDVAELDFENGYADLILAYDVLEHFPVDRVPDVLCEWYRVLKPGGRLDIQLPDFEKIVVFYQKGVSMEEIGRVIYGEKNYKNIEDLVADYHKSIWDKESMKRILKEIGFVGIEFGDINFNMRIACKKP